MIYKHQIRDMIKRLDAAGADVKRSTHVIVASNTVRFSTPNLPLEVKRRSDIQPGVVFIVKKGEA